MYVMKGGPKFWKIIKNRQDNFGGTNKLYLTVIKRIVSIQITEKWEDSLPSLFPCTARNIIQKEHIIKLNNVLLSCNRILKKM